MPAAEFSALFTSLNTLRIMVSAAKDMSDNHKIVTAVTDIQNQLMQAQGGMLAGLEKQQAQASRISELEAEIKTLKNWEAEAQRYELAAFATDVFAYRLKESMRNGEPAHWICSKCYQKSEKGFLNYESETHGRKTFKCVACNAKYDNDDIDDDEQRSMDFSPSPF